MFGQQKYVDLEMREFIKDTGLTLIAYCPLIKGAYVRDLGFPGQYVSEDSRIRLRTLKDIAKRSGSVPTSWYITGSCTAIPLPFP